MTRHVTAINILEHKTFVGAPHHGLTSNLGIFPFICLELRKGYISLVVISHCISSTMLEELGKQFREKAYHKNIFLSHKGLRFQGQLYKRYQGKQVKKIKEYRNSISRKK